MINTTQAQASAKNVVYQITSLSPSSLITLFEIDATSLAADMGVIDNDAKLFRFHNNISLINTNIKWNGEWYIAAPISAEGFDLNAKGTLPTPRLGISVNPDGVSLIGTLKDRIRVIGDLVGAKVTRIRTFAAYIDRENFLDDLPDGFVPDPNSELPRDIYYIDRKSMETKMSIEWELASVLDVEGIQLPLRRVIARCCQFSYRGDGCFYEYNSRRDTTEHGSNSSLPQAAPPIATSVNEMITDIISPSKLIDMGAWDSTKDYVIGHSVYITKNNLKYYFVAKVSNKNQQPPDKNFWIADVCSKDIVGCRKRWSSIGHGYLPFGGFLSCNRVG